MPVVDDDKKNKKSDKFKAEQDWQKEQNALNKKAYMEGEKDYEAYVERMEEIEQEYYQKVLANKKITKEEKAEAEANLAEAKKKQTDRKNSPDDWKATEEAKNRIAYAKVRRIMSNIPHAWTRSTCSIGKRRWSVLTFQLKTSWRRKRNTRRL